MHCNQLNIIGSTKRNIKNHVMNTAIKSSHNTRGR